MKVKEIMTKKVTSLSPNVDAQEALALLKKLKISGLPVIDNEGKLVGMFTEKNILSYILPSYLDKVGHFIYEGNPKATKKKFAELSALKVEQLMRKEVVTVAQEATLCEVARLMLTQKSRRLPVVDKENKLVGIIARCDVLRAFEKEAEEVQYNV